MDAVLFLETPRLILRPLLESDYTGTYLAWLNDPEVNRFSQRRPFPLTENAMRSYAGQFEKQPKSGFVLAMVDKEDHKHIGNIALVNIQLIHRCAEIAILIGEKTRWGRGLGGEAIYALTRHAFEEMNMHRIFGGTFNPAFVHCTKGIGWKEEGRFRERIWSGGKYHDQIWLGILRHEFRKISRFEMTGNAQGEER